MIVTNFPRPVRVIEHALIPLKVGTTLAARIWLPEGVEQNPVPAILEHLPYRKRDCTYERDARLSPLREPETAPPEKPTISHRDGVRVERIDRIGLELGTQYKSEYHVEENDPLSAVAELHQTQTLSRNEWQIRVETQLRLSCTGNAFLLQGSLRAFEGANEVWRGDWDRSVPRDFL